MNEKAHELIASLRETVVSTKKDSVPEKYKELFEELVSAHNLDIEVMFGGSYAKDTYLVGDHDIDMFFRFGKAYPDEELSDLTSLVLASLAPIKRVHGSRDYFQFERDGYAFEIVPVRRIDNPKEAENSTDVSPFHVSYVREAIQQKPELSLDIRLCKLFCKTAEVYGAESYIKGFSGHVIDNLIIYYGSLYELLVAATQWKTPLFIDPLRVHDNGDFLNEAKRQGPLVLLDPIQPERNAAAALGEEKCSLFVEAAKRFLEEPNTSYFVPHKKTAADIAKEYAQIEHSLYLLEGDDSVSKDVCGTKLLKAHEHACQRVKKNGFHICKETFYFDGKQAICGIGVQEKVLPDTYVREGPPIPNEKDSQRFREIHGERVFEEQGRLCAHVKREHVTLQAQLLHLLTSSFFKERTTNAKII